MFENTGANGLPSFWSAVSSHPRPRVYMGEAMNKRKSISKKLRFEVLKRDHFTCQYCGGTAPDVLLHIDHIEPVSKGGRNNILNLITSCKSCNAGKGARRLADASVVVKQRIQVEDIAEHREQLEMMLRWQREITNATELSLDYICKEWERFVPGSKPTETGRRKIRLLLKQFSVMEIIEAVQVSADTYVKEEDGEYDPTSCYHAFDKISGICHVTREQQLIPELGKLYYIRGILKKRTECYGIGYSCIIPLLKEAIKVGIAVGELSAIAKGASSIWRWKEEMEAMVKDAS